MRLLVLTELFMPTKGGTAIWFDEVYRRIGGKGVHILTASVPGQAAHDAAHPNSVRRLVLERHAWLRPESALMYAKLALAGLWTGLRHRVQAVHAGRVLPEGVVALLLGRLLRVPVTVYAHGEELTSWGRGRKHAVAAWTFRQVDRVIVNSEFTRREVLALGVAERRVVTIYPGVDTRRFRPDLPHADLRAQLGLGTGQKLVLSVGRLSRRKGFDQVIRALPMLLRAGIDAHYALIGIGEDDRHLPELARQLGVADRLHMLGHVAPEDLPRWYAACDVFAMPNREINGDTEGFGLVFLEAAACGRPALAGLAGGTGDAVLDGVTGLRVDGARTECVAEALLKLLQSSALAEALGVAAHTRARSEFDWDRVAERTRALVEADARGAGAARAAVVADAGGRSP